MSGIRISGDQMAGIFIPCILALLTVPFAIVMWPDDSGKPELDIDSVRIAAFRDGSGINIVDAEIIIAVTQLVPVSLEGDVKTKPLANGFTYGDWATRSGDGIIIRYNGLLQLIEPAAVGDTVNIIVRYGDDSRAMAVVVEGP